MSTHNSHGNTLTDQLLQTTVPFSCVAFHQVAEPPEGREGGTRGRGSRGRRERGDEMRWRKEKNGREGR